MAFGRIPLDFSAMRKAYKFYDKLHDGTPVGEEVYEWIAAQNKIEAAKGLPKSTTCCMQASMAFNVTPQKIQKAGSVGRENTYGKKTGNYYILNVQEFRAWLTYTFGPTDQVAGKSKVPDSPGVLVFGNAHIEFWDGKEVLQAPPRMSASWMWGQSPIWFWYVGSAASASASTSTAPEWLVGWWTVYDGNYYYYHFSREGIVNYIKTKPNPKWVPPTTIGNQGTVSSIANGVSVLWKPTEPGGVSTKEDFTRVGWTSTTEMNGRSNKYAPLFARKMA